jgi:hypothetical protein
MNLVGLFRELLGRPAAGEEEDRYCENDAHAPVVTD